MPIATASARKCRTLNGDVAYKPILRTVDGHIKRTTVLGQVNGRSREQGTTYAVKADAVAHAERYIAAELAAVIAKAAGWPVTRRDGGAARHLQQRFETYGGSGDVFES